MYDSLMILLFYSILAGNEITEIHPGNLSFYPLLNRIDLSNNLISHIPSDLENATVGALNEL